jgi:hypothetical protein
MGIMAQKYNKEHSHKFTQLQYDALKHLLQYFLLILDSEYS